MPNLNDISLIDYNETNSQFFFVIVGADVSA